jgi:hypothetical protein
MEINAMSAQAKRDHYNIVSGKIVFIGHHDRPADPIYIGWLGSFETHDLTALLYRLRKTRPWLQLMYWRSCSLDDAIKLRQQLCHSWAGFREWFNRTPQVEALLAAMNEESWEKSERFEEETNASWMQQCKRRQRSVKASRRIIRA